MVMKIARFLFFFSTQNRGNGITASKRDIFLLEVLSASTWINLKRKDR